MRYDKLTSAITSADTIPVSSRNSLNAADIGSSPSSIPPYNENLKGKRAATI